MSVVWTKEMAEAFLETEPDSLFPCDTHREAEKTISEWLKRYIYDVQKFTLQSALRPWSKYLRSGGDSDWAHSLETHALAVISDDKSAYDAFGRCNLKCANCNCRMLFNKLECVKADLESTKEALKTTKETLNITSEYLDDTMIELGEMKYALKEEKKERNEDKRKFSIAIENMVEAVRLLWL